MGNENITNLPKRWYYKPWFKILTFILITPLWIGIIWKDPYERKGMKIFASVCGILLIIAVITLQFSPEVKAKKEASVLWENANQSERLKMLTDFGIDNFYIIQLFSKVPKTEIKLLLGSPDATNSANNLIYYLENYNGYKGITVCILKYNNDGEYTGLSIQSGKEEF